MSLTILESGDILADPADVLVCPVCCVPGVMGKGLARGFAERWPELKGRHRWLVQGEHIRPGRVEIDPLPGINHRWIAWFPTKDHWRDSSCYEWIYWGLVSFARTLAEYRHAQAHSTRSVAIPALGCGLGGLEWSTILPIVTATAMLFPEKEFRVYSPRP
jgi:O-acetyl-ADP-ribose deacetylase (regulator of RNase III)